jgi:hypothetical protein
VSAIGEAWIESYRATLEARLDRLGAFLDEQKGPTS